MEEKASLPSSQIGELPRYRFFAFSDELFSVGNFGVMDDDGQRIGRRGCHARL